MHLIIFKQISDSRVAICGVGCHVHSVSYGALACTTRAAEHLCGTSDRICNITFVTDTGQVCDLQPHHSALGKSVPDATPAKTVKLLMTVMALAMLDGDVGYGDRPV